MGVRPVVVFLRDAAVVTVMAVLLLTAGCGGSGGHPFIIIPTTSPSPTVQPSPTPKPTPSVTRTAVITPTVLPTHTPAITPTPGHTTTPSTTPTHLPTPTPSTTPTPGPLVGSGVALAGDDDDGFIHGLQLIRVEDASGKPPPTPQQTFAPLLNAADIDGVSLSPDGKHGAMTDGVNTVYFFSSDLSKGTITILPATVNLSAYGTDGDSIASLPGGDEIVVSAGNPDVLLLISGVVSGKPVVAELIATSRKGPEYDGLVISADGMVMLSRAGSGGLLDVYSIMEVPPHPGPLGGTVSFDFTLTNTVTVPVAGSLDGREGMAVNPTDSRRAILVAGDGTVDLLEDLPANVTFKDSLKLASAANAVAISNDGRFAIIATDSGLVVLSGVDTGKLVQVGGIYSPSFPTPAGTCKLHNPDTLGVMPDGKFIVTIQPCGLPQSITHIGSGVMLTIPFSGGVLGAPVGQLNFAVTPDDDQLLTH